MRRLLAILPLVCGCLVAHEEPAVRGVPRDDRSAPLSAVWVGHATVLLRMGNRTVLTDPNLGDAILIVPRETPASLRPSDLPPIDVAVISHMHLDHFDAPTLRKLGRYPAVLFPDGGQSYADEILQPRKRALKTWESVEVRGLTVTAVPARHRGGRYGIDALWNHAATGYVIEGAGRRVYFAGDTGLHPEFAAIAERYGPFDLVLLPIGAYEPRWFMRRVHMNPEDALEAYRGLRGPYADTPSPTMLAIHWGTFRLTDEPADEPPERVRRRWAEAGLPGEALWVMRHGETKRLNTLGAR